MSYLPCLCLFVYSGIQHILCCVFVLFFLVLCAVCCSLIPFYILCSGSIYTYLCTKYSYTCMLYQCIVVSNTYCVVFLFCFSWSCVPYVASFSGLSIFDCPLCLNTIIQYWYSIYIGVDESRLYLRMQNPYLIMNRETD
jgi:hypothetical protein